MAKKVIIIGGGASGLSAGVELASKGFSVELFESRPYLGGRLYSFKDPETGDDIDNGQHLMTGFYHNTIRLLGQIGTVHLLRYQTKLAINFLEKSNGNYWFRCPVDKSMSLSFLIGLFKYSKFPKTDLLKLIINARKLKRRVEGSISAKEWLKRLGQSKRSIHSFFRPLVLATLNAELEDVSGKLLQGMLETIFQTTAKESVLVFSSVGLSQLVAEPAGRFITSNGGRVELSNHIKKIQIKNGIVDSIVDFKGEEKRADAYILALEPGQLYKLTGNEIETGLEKWKFSPIISVNVWFETSILDRYMAGFLDSCFHWCFDKSKIFNSINRYPYASMIISAADEEMEWPKEKLVEEGVKDLKSYFPQIRDLGLLHSRVIKERRATVLISPNMYDKRPPVTTRFPNLFMAGDWVDTGLPATIESAVLSGFMAAEAVKGRQCEAKG